MTTALTTTRRPRPFGYCEECEMLHATTVIDDVWGDVRTVMGIAFLRRVKMHLNRLKDAGKYRRN